MIRAPGCGWCGHYFYKSGISVVSKQEHQALARRWRPRQFADVVGQTHVVRALTNALTQQHLHHAYLLTGTRGVGKTTIARILAKCLNCESGITAQPCGECSHCRSIDGGRFVDLIEVDAASRTKVEDTRDLLDNVQYAPTLGRKKVYLIDEVHMLSGHSFNALLKTLEEPPAHVTFILATTDPQRLPATVLSRCLQFHLFALPPEPISAHLLAIAAKENIPCETKAATLLAKAADGSIRDALSLLDQSIAYGNGQVITQDVEHMLGTIDAGILRQILHSLATADANALLAHMTRLAEQGADFSRALSDLLELLHEIAIIQAVPDAPSPVMNDDLRELAAMLSREDTQLYYQIGTLGQRDLPWAPTPRSGFEMTLLRMLAFIPVTEVKNIESSAPAPKAQTKIPATASSQSTPSWPGLIPSLNLDGATKVLAEQCVLRELTDSHLKLNVHPKQKPLLNQKHIDRIRGGLTQHFGRPFTVEITVDVNTQGSPADLVIQQQELQQQAAEQVILRDPLVQQMMQTFDATIIKASMQQKQGSQV